jgi:molecular chaperone GrpE
MFSTICHKSTDGHVSAVVYDPILVMFSSGEGQPEGTGQMAESPAAEPDNGALGVITELRDSLRDLTTQMAREHDRAHAREAVIDRLHAEVERLRAGEARSLLLPAVTDLRRLRDDLSTQARSVPDGMARSEVAALLASYADSVALILERCGVVPVRPVAQETRFESREQQVVAVVGTGQADLDGIVAAVLSDGYAEVGTGRLVAAARVTVYKATRDQPVGDDRPDTGEVT